MTVDLRPASTADLTAITELFLECWRDSYAGVMPEDLVATMTDERAAALWTAALNGGTTTLVAEEERLLGVTRFQWWDDIPRAEVHSLYVAPWAQRRGVGARLLRAATRDYNRAGLWVFAANAPSIAFYRAQGWRPDGQQRVQPEFGQREIRLVKVVES